MAPIQMLLLFALPPVVAAAWFKGGRPERAAVAAILVGWAVGLVLSDWRWGRSPIGIALSDLGLLAALVWLALKHDRWWLLAASAAQSLVVVAHLALVARPDLTEGENLATLCVFNSICLLALLAGVAERWLAGEAAAAPPLALQGRGADGGAQRLHI